MENEFGKVVFIAREHVIKGYLLRQTSSGVILEFYFPDSNDVDVVVIFDNTHIRNNRDFHKCLSEVRKFVEDEDTPIYVDLNTRR